MNILMMSNTYTPILGGLEKSIRTFMLQFRKLGHKVVLVVPEMKGSPEKEYGVLRLPAIQNFSGTDFSVNLPIPGLLSKLVDSFKPDIVHAHHPFLMGDMALRLAGQYRIPLVYTYHTMFDQYHYLRVGDDAMKQFLTKLSLGYSNLADCVIAPSKSVRDILIKNEVKTRIHVVPTGINIRVFTDGSGKKLRSRLKIPPSAFLVGHVGRLAPEKNLEFLARSAARFVKQNKKAYFLVIGKGSSRKIIKTIFKKEDIEDRLRLVGVLKGEKLVEGYRAMDVFAFASESETQGIVITEAMAAGTPVVALDAPGVREVVKDRQNGRLIYSESEKRFAYALAWCADQNVREWKKIKLEARRTAEHFSIASTVNRALRVYQITKARNYTPSRIRRSQWHRVMGRVKTEWHLLTNITKATGAALAETVVSKESEHGSVASDHELKKPGPVGEIRNSSELSDNSNKKSAFPRFDFNLRLFKKR